jgi:hypothetical protein
MHAADSLQAHRLSPYTLARAMGWFSIALGVVEIACARPMARRLRMKGDENLIRAFGLREIATGVGILRAEDPRPWMWARVAGDALDIAALSLRVNRTLGTTAPIAVALTSVAGATAVDVMTARALEAPARAKSAPREFRDYSSRTGFPGGLEAARGVAKDFRLPTDLATPEPLRPWLP